MHYAARLFALALALSVFAGCASLNRGDDDLYLSNGVLMRDDDEIVIHGMWTPDFVAANGDIAVTKPAMAKIGVSGGGAVAFDIIGYNEDGTALDPQAVTMAKDMVGLAKDTWMDPVVRVLGDSTDPAFRANAVKTAAAAFKDELRPVYVIDGPDGGALASAFKKIAKKAIVAAPENGDIALVTTAPEAAPEAPVLVWDAIPSLDLPKTHFVLSGDEADYAALDQATMRPEEKAAWTPDNSVLSEEERNEGFVALFNGKNFDGWWIKGDDKEGFFVKDGIIEWDHEGAEAVMSAQRFDDFILRLEFLLPGDGTNSGIWVFAPRDGRASKLGLEVQLRGDYGVEPTDDQTGAIYRVIAPTVNARRPADEWNDLEIMTQGEHFKVTLNGVVVQDVNLSENEELRYRLRAGYVALQDHDNYVAFRNVRIKPL
ncbi:MAG: DUF1080 domain-containing protein [Candidatus Hydrogenedentes bacterium]|nr:DUF1080 domain-containing protein [Candidatus Hydrogenedentota bacterium]